MVLLTKARPCSAPCIPEPPAGLGSSSWITVLGINVHHSSLPAAFVDVPPQRRDTWAGRTLLAAAP